MGLVDMNVRIERRDGLVKITLDRPDKLNAMSDSMWAELENHLAGIDAHPHGSGEDRVLVITGAGDAFCGGSDVDGLLDDLDSLTDRIKVSNRCVLAMQQLPIPTVAMVRGIAAGSGLNMALACDFVVGAESSRFAQLFIRIGLSLDSGASWLLPRLVGERKARELCLLGGTVGAADALAMGMITQVVPDAELDERVAALTDRLLGSNPAALAGTKRLLNDTWHRDLAAALDAETKNQVSVIRTGPALRLIQKFSTPKENR